MSNWKKKFGALVPGGAARDALQNVLTVEWSGHKTVLVEVPTGDSSTRSNDVELAGFSSHARSRSGAPGGGAGGDTVGYGYDRLADEGVFDPYARHDGVGVGASSSSSSNARARGSAAERDRAGRPHDRFVRAYLDRTPSPASASAGAGARERELPALPSDSENLTAHSTAPPAPSRPTSSNPFANPFSHEDDLLADIGYAQSAGGGRRAPPVPRPRRLGSGGAAWDEAGGGRGIGGMSGMGGSVQSPTESTGSNASSVRPAVLMEEDDPFR